VSLHLGAPVVAVEHDRILLRGGTVLPFDALVWAAGAASEPLFLASDVATDPRGFVRVRPTLQLMDECDVFAAGVAAHAILQALAEQPHADPIALAAALAVELASKGRAFESTHEPPLPIDAVNEGRRLALLWHATHPLPEGASPEHGLAVDDRWRPVPYRSLTVRLRAVLDLLYPTYEEIDGEPRQGLAHLDYKSAWPTGSDDLDSLQMKIQALVALAHADEEPAFIRQEIGNLRTGQIHSRTIWLDDAGQVLLDQWRRDIETAMAAADVQPRQARPGAGCPGCPYLHACKPARALVDAPEATAARYAVLDAERARVRAIVAAQVAEQRQPIDGGFVGYVGVERRTPRPDAMIEIAALWHGATPDQRAEWDTQNAEWLGLIGALPPTMGAVNAAALTLHPYQRGSDWKVRRAAMIEGLTMPCVEIELQIVCTKET
jgi:hypothetical protein